MRTLLAFLIATATIVLTTTNVLAQGETATTRANPTWLLPVPQLDADPRIPTLQETLGYPWGEEISSHAQIEQYLRALAQAAPDRIRLVPYGKSYEGRNLVYLVVTAPENMERLEELRQVNLRLADAIATPREVAGELARSAPAIVWLAYSVHGNEISCSDAALLTAYHLLADRSDSTQAALKQLVVVIDPLQNPDGRQRFVNVFRETRGRFPAAEPWASEHTERWPGGRFNHYLFDMNRDWFAQTQQETQHKVAAYLRWQPQIYVDAHEMGHNSTYFFEPPAEPINPFLLPAQIEWLYRLGRHQAQWFDRFGFPYTTREMFDAFYPGYGSEWPTLQGGLGMLWEQASARGLVIQREDETKLYFRDGVRQHYLSGLATIEEAAKHRKRLLSDFYEARCRGVRLGQEGPVRHFFLPEGQRPQRAFQLARLLTNNGITVFRMPQTKKIIGTDIRDAKKQARDIPEGSYHIPVAQPAGRLVRALLDRKVDMAPEFIQRQLQRKELRLPDEIYDVTAWSLPLAFDVDCLATEETVEVDGLPWDGEGPTGQTLGGKAKVAYLVAASGDDNATRALAWWLRNGVRVHVADEALRLGDVHFPRGTLILRTHDNPQGLHAAVVQAAQRFGVTIHATDTGFVTEGAHLGGPYVKWIRPPEIAMLVDRPTSYSVGHTWYLFDQVWQYPVTRLAGRFLSRLDLRRYNVLVLGDGDYSGADAPGESEVARIKEWVKRGGTLILVEGATTWATGEPIGLIASQVVKQPVEAAETTPAVKPAEVKPTASGDAKDKAMEAPTSVPGAFLRADVFQHHWVTFGVSPQLDVFFSGNRIVKPIKPNRGRNLVTFRAKEDLLTSGFCWPKTLQLMSRSPYVVYQSSGKGHVIAFTDDPNYRAMYPALQRLFFNAVMFGPGH